ncbi:MAG: acetyl-CoA synthase subunit gamma [Deltaproteobacteria bacterium]|nr:acetyl-CoA synthase subunit gamma [Deltaproteobacteria bacterium]
MGGDGRNGQCACGRTAGPLVGAESVGPPWFDGAVSVEGVGEVPRVRTGLSFRDRIGSYKARWGSGRMNYRVPAGLYAVGNPGNGSPVLVSANYKMSFDCLRSSLFGRDAWILVLDTDGVNVWCSAGKGTFGTDEIAKQVEGASLDRIVSHRVLVVPQLGAPGVSAHEVRRRCGFRVEYGPVRAGDLPAYLDAGMKASPGMRKVGFGLRDRVVLIPVELVMGAKYALILAAVFLLLGGLGPDGFTLAGVRTTGLSGAALVLGSFLGGAVLGPMMLPWLPGRAFSVKGATLGLALAGGLAICGWLVSGRSGPWTHLAAWLLMAPSLASFVVMNFTGASTYTSLSGVLREMRFAVPAQIAAAVIGFGFWLGGLFIT